jgi:molecular chaperone IbpA
MISQWWVRRSSSAVVILASVKKAKENTLTIRGEKQTNDEEKSGDVLYKGIAERTFERSFQLAEVDLEREIPEAMKPRAIPIASSGKVLQVKPTKVAA